MDTVHEKSDNEQETTLLTRWWARWRNSRRVAEMPTGERVEVYEWRASRSRPEPREQLALFAEVTP